MQKKKIILKLLQWLFLCFMLKVSLKKEKNAFDLTASTNHGVPDGSVRDGNEDILINDGAVADVNCCCKHEFLCKWNCWCFSCLLGEVLEQSKCYECCGLV